MTRHKFATLDAIRGIAAILIVFRHTPMAFISPSFDQSYLAVDLFFALSGFVVAYAYEEKLLSGRLSVLSFLKVRLIRLYPLYALGIAIGLIDYFMHADELIHGGVHGLLSVGSFVLLPLLMLPSRAKPLYTVDHPAWSLFYELFVNVLYAKLVRVATNRLLYIAMVPTSIIILVYSLRHDGIDLGWNISGWYVALARVIFSFSVGVVLYRKRATQPNVNVALSWLAIALAALMLGAPVSEGWGGIVAAAKVFVLVPLIVWLGASSNPSARLTPLFDALGKISYGLYVLHVPTLSVVSRFPAFSDPNKGGTAELICFMLAMLVAVFLLDRYFDAPVRRLLTRCLTKEVRSTSNRGNVEVSR